MSEQVLGAAKPEPKLKGVRRAIPPAGTEVGVGRRSSGCVREGSAIIAAEPEKPADFTLHEEFLSWKRPLFL